MTDQRIEAAVSEWMRQIDKISLEKTGQPAKWIDPEITSNIRNAMAASIAAADAAAWRPMSEAPRDGTHILVPMKFIGADVVAYDLGAWRETTSMLRLKDEPTHWQPLPAQPKDEAKE